MCIYGLVASACLLGLIVLRLSFRITCYGQLVLVVGLEVFCGMWGGVTRGLVGAA